MISLPDIERICKFNKIHNNKYSYEKFIFISHKEPIIITCPIHGDFKQYISNHMKGNGCKKCGRILTAKKLNYSSKDFIVLSKNIHGNKYNYSETIYSKSNEKLKIICNNHGEFYQIPTNHLKGKGCPKCKGEKMSKDRRMSLDSFIKRSNIIHNNSYDYSLSKPFKNIFEKIKIICKEHGEFEQLVSTHLSGGGCINCSYNLNNYRKQDWIKRAKNRKGIFYIIKCWNNNEEFYKAGITFVSIKARYRKEMMPYNYKTIYETSSNDKEYIWELEKIFMKFNKNNHYTPSIAFGGSKYECFK